MRKKEFHLEYVIIGLLLLLLAGGLAMLLINLSKVASLEKDVQREQYAAFLYQCLFENEFPGNATCGYVFCEAEFQRSQGDIETARKVMEAYLICKQSMGEEG